MPKITIGAKKIQTPTPGPSLSPVYQRQGKKILVFY